MKGRNAGKSISTEPQVLIDETIGVFVVETSARLEKVVPSQNAGKWQLTLEVYYSWPGTPKIPGS